MLLRLIRSLFRGRGGPGGGSPPFGLFLLAYQLIARIGLSNLPPATLILIGLQIGLFLRIVDVPWSDLPRSNICLRADAIVAGDYKRCFIAPLEHVSDIHLYYNMVSLAWKGMKLEKSNRYGTLGFIGLLVMFAILTGVVYSGLSYAAAELLEDVSYIHQCSVGFSGILFALKVVANNEDPAGSQENFGFFSISRSLAPWAELVIIQLLVPQASFFGHLAGVISGFIFINMFNPFSILTNVSKIVRYPITIFYSVLLYMIHIDVLRKPWNSKHFWSSSTSLVCLSVNRFMGYEIGKINMDMWRLISGPLEHASATHLVICLVSFINKGHLLERSRVKLWKLFFAIPSVVLLTPCLYIALSVVLSFLTGQEQFKSACVQGLSGPLFALKVICIVVKWHERDVPISLFAVPSPSLMFEIGEMMILLEKRTFCYHFSGVLVGLLYCSFYYNWCRRRFPGTGIQLGYSSHSLVTDVHSQRSSEPWTRSWGYGTSRGLPIMRKNARNVDVPNINERNNIENYNDNDNQNSTESSNSTYSSDGSIDGIPLQNSQSPPTFTYGGERTDERDLTMSPAVSSQELSITPLQPSDASNIINPSIATENSLRLASGSNQQILQPVATPPEPSYFSEANPPQVPFGLGGGISISEESQSEEEHDSSSYSSDGTNEPEESSNDPRRELQERDSNPTAQEHVMFEDPVISVEELRERRIERFS